MIRVRLLGRMGNQMFQYAFAYLSAKKLNAKFILDTNWVPFDLSCFELKSPYNLLTNKWFFKGYNYVQKKIKFSHKVENLDCTIDISQLRITDDTEYIGYFQEGLFYKEHKQELQKLFTIKRKYQDDFHKKYDPLLSRKKSIVVSIRLGDYRKFGIREYNNANMLMPLDWYKEQLAKYLHLDVEIFFISDELETVKKEFADTGKKMHFVDDSVINQFQLLQHADICIIPNSTFAWWGGFLNKKEDSVIIAPNYFVGYWIKKEYPKGIQNVDFTWV